MATPAQLQLMSTIEDCGSLSAAARALGLTPAAVLHRVVVAERDCGAPLVLRTARGATLTRAGETLAAFGREIQTVSEAADSALTRLRGALASRLRVGTFQAAALHLLPPALTALRHRHPDADISVVDVASEDALDAVISGRLDLVLAASWRGPLQAPAPATADPLLSDPMTVVLPRKHPLAQAHPPGTSLRLSQLRHEHWISLAPGRAARRQLEEAAAAAGFTPDVRVETESYDVAQALVGTGIGVALVSRLALAETEGITHRPLGRPRLHRHIHAVTRTDADLTPLVGLLVTLLRDVGRDITATW